MRCTKQFKVSLNLRAGEIILQIIIFVKVKSFKISTVTDEQKPDRFKLRKNQIPLRDPND